MSFVKQIIYENNRVWQYDANKKSPTVNWHRRASHKQGAGAWTYLKHPFGAGVPPTVEPPDATGYICDNKIVIYSFF